MAHHITDYTLKGFNWQTTRKYLGIVPTKLEPDMSNKQHATGQLT